jgi:hypothetical protein
VLPDRVKAINIDGVDYLLDAPRKQVYVHDVDRPVYIGMLRDDGTIDTNTDNVIVQTPRGSKLDNQ